MAIKKILISFAKAGATFCGRKDHILEAIDFAGRNLYAKHGIHILDVNVGDIYDTVLTVSVPDDISDSFSVGNHLRGISGYLLKNYTTTGKILQLVYYKCV